MQDLGTLGGAWGSANAINNASQIAGAASPATGHKRAVRWDAGTIGELGSLGSFRSYGWGINNHGDVAGYKWSTGGYVAFLWRDGGANGPGGSSPVVLGPTWSWAYDVNDARQVVGYFRVPGGYHAFLWEGNAMQDLGTLGGSRSYAYGINNAGQVVGYSRITSGATRAMVYIDGTMYNLNDLIPSGSGWTLSEAWDVNDSGQIVGDGVYNGDVRAFLLTPDIVDPAPPMLEEVVVESGTKLTPGLGGVVVEAGTRGYGLGGVVLELTPAE